ncbi:MAG: lipoprotein-releasing ABC transporter permease subunit [Halieaceae bacterium]
MSFRISDRLPFFIGLRYSFSRQNNRFIGVVSLVSLLGMALGIASLITVLSVMNGFAGELRDRILSLVPHVQVLSVAGTLEDWPELAESVGAEPEVLGAAPYIDSKVLLGSRRNVRGAQLTAIDPLLEASVSDVGAYMLSGRFEALAEQRYGIVLGSLQARSLGVELGDAVEVTVPRLVVSPLGSFPRSKRFTVVGIFEVGAQLDSHQSYINLAAGQRLLGLGEGVGGLRVRLRDLFTAATTADSLGVALGPDYRARDWSQSQGNLFTAIQMEKTMMTVLLLSVVAVAAFNIISTLTMAVTEKRSDIAVLRTMGARAWEIMAIFVAHGLLLALSGILLGVVVGVSLALNISEVTLFIEQLTGTKLFNPQVYFISDLPARLQWRDVAVVALLALGLSLLATLFPAWRATRIAPAEVLRYE